MRGGEKQKERERASERACLRGSELVSHRIRLLGQGLIGRLIVLIQASCSNDTAVGSHSVHKYCQSEPNFAYQRFDRYVEVAVRVKGISQLWVLLL